MQWKDDPRLPSTGNLWKQMREQDTAGKVPARHLETAGNVDTALKSAAKTVSQTYKYHYNGHAVIGPSVAVADVTKDSAVVYSNTQQLINIGTAVATQLGMPAKNVRTYFFEGSARTASRRRDSTSLRRRRSSRRSIGKPVRLQLMRWDENGWDLFGPAQLMDVRGGIDANGKIVAYDFTSLSQPPSNFPTTRELLGEPIPAPGTAGPNTENTAAAYAIQNKRVTGKTLPVFEGYLKRANLRNPQGPQTAFAAEQMIDELAYAAGMDAIAFRRQNITDERWLAALNAAAQAANWQPRVSASNLSDANVVTGRGFGFGRHGNSAYSAIVVEIEVNKKTGKIVVKHLYSAMDAGLSISPALVENQMVGAGVQAVSRALHETVAFNTTRVTEPRLGHVPDPALQGHAEGDDGRRPAQGAATAGRGRVGASGDRAGDRQRVLRRDRRAHPRGADDARARAPRAAGRGHEVGSPLGANVQWSRGPERAPGFVTATVGAPAAY